MQVNALVSMYTGRPSTPTTRGVLLTPRLQGSSRIASPCPGSYGRRTAGGIVPQWLIRKRPAAPRNSVLTGAKVVSEESAHDLI